MNGKSHTRSSLPVRGSLKTHYLLSAVIAVLMAFAAAGGFFAPHNIYPSDELVQAFQATDLTTLLFGVPILVLSIVLTARGRLLGLLFWPGVMMYVLYSYLVYVLAMPLNWAYGVHLLLVLMSAYSLVALVSLVDLDLVQARLGGKIPHRFGGGVLALLGAGFFLRAAVMLVGGMGAGDSMPVAEIALNSTDFLITPIWLICGVALWLRKPLGTVTGLGVLFQGSMLFVGLIVVLLLQPVLVGGPMPWVDVVIVAVFGLVTFVPLVMYIRSVNRSQENVEEIYRRNEN